VILSNNYRNLLLKLEFNDFYSTYFQIFEISDLSMHRLKCFNAERILKNFRVQIREASYWNYYSPC